MNIAYLKIVAPYVGCAGVEQKGREAWVTPDQWSIYDTTDSYAVANPVHVEHLIVMLPKQRLVERGLSLEPLMARRLGGTGGVARLALETMRSAYRELPGMSETSARSVGDAITQFVHLSMLDLAGIGTATTQREALRERIKQHVSAHLGDPALSVDGIALALNCSRRQLYNAFSEEPDGVAGYVLRRRLEACRRSFDDPASAHRSITDIAFSFGFSNMAHFSRVFRSHLGLPPSDYRRAGAAAGG
ncbi:MAG TPA: helix-turn-helix domain-containing protein [Albitalea sp.]